MTQEDKELLLKDLCARLRYGVYIHFKSKYNCNVVVDKLESPIYVYIETHLDDDDGDIEVIKPYLRPMSSMTEEEREEYHGLMWTEYTKVGDKYYRHTIESIDWLIAHHFDYRGLIEKGLALEAPEDMYKFE